jgi:hypothetical protein
VSKQTQAKRAAKQRKQQQRDTRRAATARPADATAPPPSGEQALINLVFAAADAQAGGNPRAAEDCALTLVASGRPLASVQQTVVLVLCDGLLHGWRRGWQPADLHQLARRRLGREHVALLAHLLASAMQRYAPATVDERWTEQLRDLGALVYWPPNGNALAAWQEAERQEALGRKGRGPSDAMGAIITAIELMALFSTLERLAPLLPLPGQAGERRASPQGAVDQKVLARVRALLAKAESTEFDEEAEALSAKAQELMTRHSIERIVVEAGVEADPSLPGACRIWLDAPYAGAKALLVQAVAGANRCAGVWTEHLGFMTVVGDEPDLAATELLVTSLLVQATRAMLHAPKVDPSRQRSFRQSFLVAYATRIGERLDHARDEVTDDVQRSTGADLVPVLAAHDERVDEARDRMFPRMTSKSVSVSNGHGYQAGRAAADLAVLPTGQQLGT